MPRHRAQKGPCDICDATQYLTWHHIQPRRAGGKDHPGNLVSLCTYCHAQVEAFYWSAYAAKQRTLTSAMSKVLLALHEKSVPTDRFAAAKDLVNTGWTLLLDNLRYDFKDWRQLYKKAKAWVPTTVRLRDIPVGNALVEPCWWRLRGDI